MESVGFPAEARARAEAPTAPPLVISGIPVEFPFEPYDCQRDYMEKVIMALQNSQNALLESPTGTGKTLCLLCAALAWRESLKPYRQQHTSDEPGGSNWSPFTSNVLPPPDRLALPGATAAVYPSGIAAQLIQQQQQQQPQQQQAPGGAPAGSGLPTIIYSSRTHSQLAQVIKELRNTSYKDRVRSGILSSRGQTCLHPTVSKLAGGAANQACRSAVTHKKCKWYNNLKFRNTNAQRDWSGSLGPIPDIEDLVTTGRAQEVCPFYMGRDVAARADIVFMPYNYLLDPTMRGSLAESVNWSNAVVIFDEAHNVESVSSEASSFDITAKQLTDALNETRSAREACLERLNQGVNCAEPAGAGAAADHAPADYHQLARDLECLQQVLKVVENAVHGLASQLTNEGLSRPGGWLLEFFKGVNITAVTLPVLNDAIDKAEGVLQEADAMRGGGRPGGAVALKHLQHCLQMVFNTEAPIRLNGPPAHKGYRTNVHLERSWGQDKLPAPTLSFWCFIPGIAFRQLAALGLRSILLTSGTLAPLESFAAELQLPFPHRLENPHIITPSQVWVGTVGTGPTNAALNSNYQGRSDAHYKSDLGLLIINVARIVPDGLLVFFPSYTVLEMCTKHWKETMSGTRTIWQQLSEHKAPVEEPRASAMFPAAIDEFRARLDDPAGRGAVFFAVCRGKVSEGLDFSDRAGRAVIITGIPFANSRDARVRLKREVLEEECRGQGVTGQRGGLTGEQWYVQQAMRAVNQAMGRVIRHRWDYGAIILADVRFAQPSTTRQLSKWLQEHVVAYPSFGAAQGKLVKFFKEKQGFKAPEGYVSKGSSAAAAATATAGAAAGSGANASASAAAAATANPFQFLGNVAGGGGGGRPASGRLLLDDLPAAFDVSGFGNLSGARGGAAGTAGGCGRDACGAPGGCGGGGGSGGGGLLDMLQKQQQQPPRPTAAVASHAKQPASVSPTLLSVASLIAGSPAQASEPAAATASGRSGNVGATAVETAGGTGRPPLPRSHITVAYQQSAVTPIDGTATAARTVAHVATPAGGTPVIAKYDLGMSSDVTTSAPPVSTGGLHQHHVSDSAPPDDKVPSGRTTGVAAAAAANAAVAGTATVAAAATASSRPTPSEFMDRLKRELPTAIMAAVQKLLGQYRQVKDVHAFIEAILQLLKGAATAHLLEGFAAFVPKKERSWFLQVAKVHMDAASASGGQDVAATAAEVPPGALGGGADPPHAGAMGSSNGGQQPSAATAAGTSGRTTAAARMADNRFARSEGGLLAGGTSVGATAGATGQSPHQQQHQTSHPPQPQLQQQQQQQQAKQQQQSLHQEAKQQHQQHQHQRPNAQNEPPRQQQQQQQGQSAHKQTSSRGQSLPVAAGIGPQPIKGAQSTGGTQSGTAAPGQSRPLTKRPPEPLAGDAKRRSASGGDPAAPAASSKGGQGGNSKAAAPSTPNNNIASARGTAVPNASSTASRQPAAKGPGSFAAAAATAKTPGFSAATSGTASGAKGPGPSGPAATATPAAASRSSAPATGGAPARPAAATAASVLTSSRCCEVCQKAPMTKGHSGPCGHVACYSCWLTVLAITFACPTCKRPTRRNQLTPSYFT